VRACATSGELVEGGSPHHVSTILGRVEGGLLFVEVRSKRRAVTVQVNEPMSEPVT